MAFRPPPHPDFLLALRVLDATGMPYAEAWRMLRPVAARLGVPRPSYSTVRRFLVAERRRKRERLDELDRVLADVFRGLGPVLVYEKHKRRVARRGGVERSGPGGRPLGSRGRGRRSYGGPLAERVPRRE